VAYQWHVEPCYNREFVFQYTLPSWPRPGSSSAVGATPSLEVLALLQQVAVLKRKRPRPLLTSCDRLFWTVLQSLWSRWTRSSSSCRRRSSDGAEPASTLAMAVPSGGWPKVSTELRVLIRRLAEENSNWDAPDDSWGAVEAWDRRKAIAWP